MKIWILTTTVIGEPECTGATPYLSRAAAEAAAKQVLTETSDVENSIHEHDIGVSIEDLKTLVEIAELFADTYQEAGDETPSKYEVAIDNANKVIEEIEQ